MALSTQSYPQQTPLPLSVNAWSPRSWIRLKSSPPSRLGGKKKYSERSGNQQVTPPPHTPLLPKEAKC